MSVKIKNSHTIGLISITAIFILRIILYTCKIRYINKEYIDEYLLGERKVVITTWHRCSVYFLLKYSYIHPMILFSMSKDGELLANFAKKLGVIPARGSSTRGGKEGSRQMVDFLKTGGRVVATVADGPQGPAFRAKPGLARVAQKSGQPLLPLVWSADRTWMFTGSWDNMIIPKPFANIIIYASKPFTIPTDADGGEFDMQVKKMERILNEMTMEADDMAGHHDPNMDIILKEGY